MQVLRYIVLMSCMLRHAVFIVIFIELLKLDLFSDIQK